MDWRSENAKYLVAIFSSNACAAIAFAILAPALVANLTGMHTSSFMIAVVTSIWALPSVVGGPLFTRLIARFNAKICLLIGVFFLRFHTAEFSVVPQRLGVGCPAVGKWHRGGAFLHRDGIVAQSLLI